MASRTVWIMPFTTSLWNSVNASDARDLLYKFCRVIEDLDHRAIEDLVVLGV